MKAIKINSINLIFFWLSFVCISSTENKRFLTESIFNQITPELKDDVYNYTINAEQNYYSYDFSDHSGKYMVITLSANKYISKNVKCLLSNSEEEIKIQEDLDKETNNICEVYQSDDKHLVNVIVPLTNRKEDEKLYFKLNLGSIKDGINFYFRRKGGYQTILKSKDELKNIYAYQAFEFKKTDYYQQEERLFISSIEDSIIVFGKKDGRKTLIDQTSIFVVTEHTLASIFWYFDEIIFFVGKDKETEKSISLNLVHLNEENKESIKIRYYNGNQFGNAFISLYDNCFEKKTEYYLIVNYGKMNNDFFCRLHNLVGSDSYLADLPVGKEDVKSLTYNKIDKYIEIQKTDNHLHVWKLTCPGNGNKLIANIKYTNKLGSKSNGEIKDIIINDYYTSGNDKFTLDYSGLIIANSSMFSLEIYTPNTNTQKEFTVSFEGKKDIKIDNQYAKIFKIKDESKTELTIDMPNKDDAIISLIPSSIDKNYMFSEEKKFESYINGEIEDISYKVYYLEHEFDCNFNVSFEIENRGEDIIEVCSYVITMPLIQTNALNCFLMPGKETQNITFANIYNHIGDDSYKLKEPFYSPIVYSSGPILMKKLYLVTDLPKSTPINTYADGLRHYYTDADLKKGEASYFSIHLTNSSAEKNFEIFINNDISQFTEQLFEIQCISAYEFALNYVQNLFEEGNNNLCYFMNKDDYNSNVSHIIYKNTDDNKYHNFIIKITPKYDLKIKIVISDVHFINYDYKIIEKTIQTISTSNMFTFYEFNENDLKKFSNYNNIIFYSYQDKIEIYGRNGYNFDEIEKNYFIRFRVNDFLNSDKYEKYLIGFGKTIYSQEQSLQFKYQLLTINHLYYYPIGEFEGFFRIPINIKNCQKDDPHYIMLDYQNTDGKNISLANYTLLGNSKHVNYIDAFRNEEFEKGLLPLENFKKINQNKLNLNVIKLTCENSYFAYFDYFCENSITNIKLEEGTIKHYIMPKEKKLTFTYEKINEIIIETIPKTVPKITFESKTMELKDSYTLIREKKDINEFYAENQLKKDNQPLRVIPKVNLGNYEKSPVSNNLYIVGNKFIYEIPQKAVNVTLRIKPLSTRLRLLEEGMEICYIASKIVILDLYGGNCFNVKDVYDLKYSVPQDGEKGKYLILYPSDSKKKFTVEKVTIYDKDGKSQEDSNGKDDDDDGGSKAWIIVLIIILVIIIIAIAAVLIFRMRRKRITNADIEKEVKRVPSLTPVTN